MIISFSAFGQSAKNLKFEMEGKVKNCDTGFVVLYYYTTINKLVSDTAKVIEGKFRFKGNIDGPTIARFTGEVKSKSFVDPNTTTLFIEPTLMKVTVEVDNFKNAELKGSNTQLEYAKFLQQKSPYYKYLDSLLKKKASIFSQKKSVDIESAKGTLDSIADDIAVSRHKMTGVELNFVKVHQNSVVSAYVLMSYTGGSQISLDSSQHLFNNLSLSVKKSILGAQLSEQLKIQHKAKSIEINSGQPGKEAFNFKRISNKNGEIELSFFRNRNYVLLDFWATWCLPCLKYIPHLKKMSRMYKSKGLRIISVSSDYNFMVWKNGIEKYKLDEFINVHDYDTLKDLESHNIVNSIAKRYSIDRIPTSILIDKNGTIIGRYMANENNEVPELDRKLEEIFK